MKQNDAYFFFVWTINWFNHSIAVHKTLKKQTKSKYKPLKAHHKRTSIMQEIPQDCRPEGFCTHSLVPGIHQVCAHLPNVSEALAFSYASMRAAYASVEAGSMALATHRAIVCLFDWSTGMNALPSYRNFGCVGMLP